MEGGGWRGVVTPRTEPEGIEAIEAIETIEAIEIIDITATINNKLLRL